MLIYNGDAGLVASLTFVTAGFGSCAVSGRTGPFLHCRCRGFCRRSSFNQASAIRSCLQCCNVVVTLCVYSSTSAARLVPTRLLLKASLLDNPLRSSGVVEPEPDKIRVSELGLIEELLKLPLDPTGLYRSFRLLGT